MVRPVVLLWPLPFDEELTCVVKIFSITKRNSLNQINMLHLIPFDPLTRNTKKCGANGAPLWNPHWWWRQRLDGYHFQYDEMWLTMARFDINPDWQRSLPGLNMALKWFAMTLHCNYILYLFHCYCSRQLFRYCPWKCAAINQDIYLKGVSNCISDSQNTYILYTTCHIKSFVGSLGCLRSRGTKYLTIKSRKLILR